MADRIGHPFVDPGLLQIAVCHRSWCAEHPGFASNERLEFLGDAVLGAVVAEELYRRFPAADEGWLSRARATVVRASTLADAAEEIDLGSELRLGKGEEATGGREKPSIMADALEALIGAVHLDGGRLASAAVVMNLLGLRIVGASGEPGHHDDKSRLQELASRELRELVTYTVTETGLEHDKTFVATVRIGTRTLGTGTGRSKKQAQQLAARAAHDVLTGVPAVAAAGTAPTAPTLADTESAPNDEAENA
ncbi:ribonuclease III [Iamia sp.]|uniref:ribonuclease III n=1 Tax=Iamia sp. TaxID=2722710 RepID=UPI002C9C76D0|nr:ribonuclease III [Iamia sp.]HXH55989.1 ribonuclease III [Iamia sp.]